MDNKKPAATEKIVLPKSLQREMIKFFAQASMTRNAADDKDNQQTLEIPKKGVLKVDKHRHLRSGANPTKKHMYTQSRIGGSPRLFSILH